MIYGCSPVIWIDVAGIDGTPGEDDPPFPEEPPVDEELPEVEGLPGETTVPPDGLLPPEDAEPPDDDCFSEDCTVTTQTAFLPLAVRAVIFAVPGRIAVTSPVRLTLATEALLLNHVVVFVAFFGVIFADNCWVCPARRDTEVLFSFIFFAFGRTVTLHLALTPLAAFTVMMVVPAFFALITPFFVTFGLLLVHLTAEAAFCGFRV